MAKKDKNGYQPSLIRIILFLAIAGGLIYWLSSQIESESLETGFNKEGKVMGQEIEAISQGIDQVLPKVVKQQVEKINQRFYQDGDQVIKETEQIIRETKLAEEIEKIILQTTDEIDGFPEKQKKDIKKEAIRQVCETLINEIEDDENKE